MIKSPARETDITDLALDRFWETIPPLWSQVRAHVRAMAMEQFSVSVEQFQLLRLVRSGRTSVSALAAAKNISRPAISQAVDVLVLKRMLTRTQDVDDRRHSQLALTKAGDAMLDIIFEDTRAWMRLKLGSLSQSELESISEAMHSLKKMLD